MDLVEAQELWDAEPGWLNTASYGLPPKPAWYALQGALTEWRGGLVSWRVWEASVDRARSSFARLVGVDSDDIGIGPNVSALLAPIASSLPAGSKVVVPDIEFTSNLFPWLVHADRGVEIAAVPVDDLANRIDDRTTLVAFSLVQSATGAIMPVDEIVSAARQHGALVSVDATQACGWLPVDASQFDVLVCAGYKWLMSPKGAAFCMVRRDVRDRFRPVNAGWFAAEDVHGSYYGLPMELAASGRRYDLSPAWFSWVAAEPTLELVEGIGIDAINRHNVDLARRFCRALGITEGNSAIVSVDIADAEQRFADAGIRGAARHGRLRVSFHLYNTTDDVDRAAEVLTPS